MKRFSILAAILALVGLACLGATPGKVLADGDEILGPPSIPIASGTGIVAAGTGLITPPGTINLNVPLGASINQALLYWEQDVPVGGLGIPSATIQVDGISVNGALIGITIPSDRYVYRADVTFLVNPGPNSFEVVGLASPPTINDGAGILVIIDDGSGASQIEIRDGSDFAFAPFSPPLDTTVPQTYNFDPAPIARVATLDMFFASVSGSASGGGFRPSAIEITIDGSTSVFDNLLDSNDGDEWDTANLDIPIPAGATSLTVQALSVDNDPPDTGPEGQEEGEEASFVWITAGLALPEEEEGCLTRTPGFWCTHDRVTELFLPVDSCGITLINIEAASSGSAIEDLDFSGRDFKANDTSPQQLQLIRQCTAAALNFAASAQAGGSCSGIVLSDGRTIDEVFAACCEDLCTSGVSGPTISESNCIERLDEFNNLEPDTLTCETDPQAPFPFCPSLGANGFNATPETCQEANGNGFVNPGRNLGPKNGGGSNGEKGKKKGKK